MNYTVKNVEVLDNYVLKLKFEDGTTRLCDLSDQIERGIFKAFKDYDFFRRARVHCGTVIWNEDIDIAPEYLYEHGEIIA